MSTTTLSSATLTGTLAAWCDKHNVGARPYVKEGYDPMMTVTSYRLSSDASWDLHHLTDYVVTGNSGGSVWLAPRRNA